MAISPTDFDEAFIASAKALLITGTHLSRAGDRGDVPTARSPTRAANDVRTRARHRLSPGACGASRARPTARTRYVADQGVTAASAGDRCREFDLMIGTEEEFRIAGGGDDLIVALHARARARAAALLVVKRGPLGCCGLEGEVPAALDDAPHFAGVQVEVLNVLGAGDAFASGLSHRLAARRNRSTPARATPTLAAPSWSRATPARRRCRRRPSSTTSSAHADRRTPHARRRSRADAPASRHRRAASAGTSCSCSPSITAASSSSSRRKPAPAKRACPALKRLLVDAVAHVESEQQHGLAGRIGVLIDDIYGGTRSTPPPAAAGGSGGRSSCPARNPLVFDRGRSIGTALLYWPRNTSSSASCTITRTTRWTTRLEQEAQVQSSVRRRAGLAATSCCSR